MNVAEIRGLCKEYPSFRLCDVSFDLAPSRITGFIGRNGAGKTTTIKSMLGLVRPTSGSVAYFGVPFAGNEDAIKPRIGYSAGVVNYYPKKRIRDLVAVTKSFYPNWDEAAYSELLELFGLDEEKRPCELSDGMKVKLNLLLALSHRAEILILDEPTSGLDPFSREELIDVLKTLRERGAAILFSTHIISDVVKCADDVAYIRQGRLAAAMPREDFIARFGLEGETLEETVVRLERSEADA